MKLFLTLVIGLGYGITASAEYRAFKLHIISPDGQSERTVISTLDPDQYRGYHLIREGETVTYSRTWMCFGRTSDMQPICPDPLPPPETPPTPEESPVSTP